MSPPGDATQLLARWSQGDRGALDEVTSLLYEQLHRIAASQVRGERCVTVQPTSLVNDVFLRLVKLDHVDWQNRGHFLAMFAKVARQTLVDEARRRNADKRAASLSVTVDASLAGQTEGGYSVIEVDQLLTQLAEFDPPAAEVIELRVFGGMNIEEAAAHLGVSQATVSRKWRVGKAWLAHQLGVA